MISPQAREQRLVDAVEVRVGLGGEDLGERRLGGGHHQRVAVEGAVLGDGAVLDDGGELVAHADRAAGEAAAGGLRQGDHVGLHAEVLRRAAGGDRRAGLDLVEDQLHAVARGEVADALEVARARAGRC